MPVSYQSVSDSGWSNTAIHVAGWPLLDPSVYHASEGIGAYPLWKGLASISSIGTGAVDFSST